MRIVPLPWQPLVAAAEAEFGIVGIIPAAMFRAQIAHESARFTRLEENLNYSAAGLRATWPKRFPTLEIAQAFARKPEAIAERVYGGRMGNIDPGDGWKYRGRGLPQITFKANYRACGIALGLDLIKDPDLLLEKANAARSAGWYWAFHGCQKLAEANDFEGVTKRINGGLNGLEDRKHLFDLELSCAPS